MKKTEKFIVIRNTETGDFLVDYKSNKGAFAYNSVWTDDLQDASTGTLEAIEKQSDQMHNIAKALKGELLVVNATYELETLDGNEPKDLTEDIKTAKRKRFENFLSELLADGKDYDTYKEE